MYKEIATYQDLFNYLKTLTDQQLKQKIQITNPGPNVIVELMPILSIGTVEDMEFYGSRSSVDNEYHADEIVMLADYNGFAEDGATSYLYEGKRNADDYTLKPMYDIGQTAPEKQLSPQACKKRNIEKVFEGRSMETVVNHVMERYKN